MNEVFIDDTSSPPADPKDQINVLLDEATAHLERFRELVGLPTEPNGHDRKLLAQLIEDGIDAYEYVEENIAVRDRWGHISIDEEALLEYNLAQTALIKAMRISRTSESTNEEMERILRMAASFALIAKEILELDGNGDLLMHPSDRIEVITHLGSINGAGEKNN